MKKVQVRCSNMINDTSRREMAISLDTCLLTHIFGSRYVYTIRTNSYGWNKVITYGVIHQYVLTDTHPRGNTRQGTESRRTETDLIA